MKCSPLTEAIPASVIADTVTRINLNRLSSVIDYNAACKGGFTVENAPNWIYVDSNTNNLFIAPPNKVSVIRDENDEYEFLIDTWQIKIRVGAPCNIKNI